MHFHTTYNYRVHCSCSLLPASEGILSDAVAVVPQVDPTCRPVCSCRRVEFTTLDHAERQGGATVFESGGTKSASGASIETFHHIFAHGEGYKSGSHLTTFWGLLEPLRGFSNLWLHRDCALGRDLRLALALGGSNCDHSSRRYEGTRGTNC